MSRSEQTSVGFFDSGLGGLCIRSAFIRACPRVSTVYLADSAFCPYGSRPAGEIAARAFEITRRLLAARCGLIVVACNTATAAAIDALRAAFPRVPFVGLEPAVKPAALRTKTGIVGVLATEGTFGGRLYRETLARSARSVRVVASVADEFVALVESCPRALALARSPSARPRPSCAACARRAACLSVVRRRVEPLLDAGADRLVLGCTHFPHLAPLLREVCAGRAVLVDPSAAVARQARRLLQDLDPSLGAASVAPVHLFVRT